MQRAQRGLSEVLEVFSIGSMYRSLEKSLESGAASVPSKYDSFLDKTLLVTVGGISEATRIGLYGVAAYYSISPLMQCIADKLQ
jgi:hypothetical protein